MRYGIISDVHANLPALEEVLRELEGLDEVIYLGDLVGYGPNPNECIERVRERCGVVIRGNHDVAAIGGKDLSWFNEYAREAIVWTSKMLSYENRSYLEGLQERVDLDEWTIVHGSLLDHTDEYILSSIEANKSLEILERKILFVGHTHVPSIFYLGGARRLLDGEKIPLERREKAIVNVGSVGQPRDGNPRASFGIVDTEEGEIEIRRISYDITRTQEMMRREGLPRYLIERLSVGV
jgi:predicted phosphodiesterase